MKNVKSQKRKTPTQWERRTSFCLVCSAICWKMRDFSQKKRKLIKSLQRRKLFFSPTKKLKSLSSSRDISFSSCLSLIPVFSLQLFFFMFLWVIYTGKTEVKEKRDLKVKRWRCFFVLSTIEKLNQWMKKIRIY